MVVPSYLLWFNKLYIFLIQNLMIWDKNMRKNTLAQESFVHHKVHVIWSVSGSHINFVCRKLLGHILPDAPIYIIPLYMGRLIIFLWYLLTYKYEHYIFLNIILDHKKWQFWSDRFLLPIPRNWPFFRRIVYFWVHMYIRYRTLFSYKPDPMPSFLGIL